MPCPICGRGRCSHDLSKMMEEFSRLLITVLASQGILVRVVDIRGLSIHLRNRTRTPFSEDDIGRMEDLFQVADFRLDKNSVWATVPKHKLGTLHDTLRNVRAVITGERLPRFK